jgi:dolichol-phosphate mannosyltransferase
MGKIFSVIIPVYQCRDSVEQATSNILSLQNLLPEYQLELVMVDDGSTDGSRERLLQLQRANREKMRLVLLSRNFGQTPAIQAGLQHASGDVIGIISCDMQEPYLKFCEMLILWEKGNLFVIGERVERSESKWHQQVSAIYWRLVRHFAFSSFPEMGYDFCILDRKLIENINSLNEKNSSIFVLLFWLGYKPAKVPIIRARRTIGASQWKFSRKVRFTIDTLIGFTVLPARCITFAGLGTAILAILYLGFLTIRWSMLRSAPPGWMTVVGLIILFGSLNLFGLGILSEYLLRILDESRKRPPFVVEAVIGKSDN